MPNKRRGGGVSDTTEITPRDDAMLLRFVELLSEETVVDKLRSLFNSKTLTDTLDSLAETIAKLNDRLDKKYVYIADLEARLSSVVADLDLLEQYSRRSNLRFFGIPESDGREDTTGKLLSIVNDTMGVTPPIVNADVVTSHRLGRRLPAADAHDQ